MSPMLIAALGGRLVAVKFDVDDAHEPEALADLRRETRGAFDFMRDDRALAPIARHLRDYLAGKRRDLGIPFDVSWVTPFRRAVLLEVARVPRGRVASYGEIARRVGRPNAYRAVGNTMRTNPIPLVIPCHRIVGSDGSLTGFGGGLEMKRRLLDLEGAIVQ